MGKFMFTSRGEFSHCVIRSDQHMHVERNFNSLLE